MKINRVAKYVGAMIGPDGYLHRWTAPRNTVVDVCTRIKESSKSLFKRLVEFVKICVILVEPWRLRGRT